MSSPKRLYKIEKGRMVDGVCGGIGEYFNIDPTLVRLVWVIFTLCTAFFGGILAYFIAALIMPRKADVVK